MDTLLPLTEAISLTAGHPRSVLLGNGFSVSRASGSFSYKNLFEHCALPDPSAIRSLFAALDTVDFERVMEALEDASVVETAYDATDRASLFKEAAATLREALITAIRTVHPSIQYEVPEHQNTACADFLANFENSFTLNYELLLYWVILNASALKHRDGFGLGKEIGGFRTFSEDADCSIYYLHGALHLFLSKQLDTQKRILTSTTILDAISETIRRRGQLPMFVAEGTSAQKLSKIFSIPYLRICYDKLTAASGSLFVFGHSVSDNDAHIYDAIFESNIETFVFCVHNPAQNLPEMKERLARYRERRVDIKFLYVDASTANVWHAVKP